MRSEGVYSTEVGIGWIVLGWVWDWGTYARV